MATPLPLQEMLDRSSGPTKSGFDLNVIEYSPKISQKSYNGPSQEASRKELWNVRWKQLEFLTAQEVIDLGRVSELDFVRNFYENNFIGELEWKPFELTTTRIWKIVHNTWKQTNTAGCIFDVAFDIEFLYNKP